MTTATLPSPSAPQLAPAPQSPYAEHKLAGERALAAAAAPRTVSLRYFNVYGPRQDPSSPYSGVISLFARWARAGERVRYHGDGGQTRDFVYAADVARANYLAGSAAAAGELAQGAVFNIGTGHSVSIRELWEGLCAALGREPGEPELMEPRAGDVRHSSADVSAAAAAFGFHAEVPLEEDTLPIEDVDVRIGDLAVQEQGQIHALHGRHAVTDTLPAGDSVLRVRGRTSRIELHTMDEA